MAKGVDFFNLGGIIVLQKQCSSGVTGSHEGLKILWQQCRAGSIPASSTGAMLLLEETQDTLHNDARVRDARQKQGEERRKIASIQKRPKCGLFLFSG